MFFCIQFASDQKNEVKKARTELAYFTEALLINLQRLEKREELSESEKEMCRVASQKGLQSNNFGLFKDSSYRGLYNMNLGKLKDYKGYQSAGSNDNLYNYMKHLELAANNFRALLTAENIKNKDSVTEEEMYRIASVIGSEIREQVIKNININPEDIPLEKEPIKIIKKDTKEVIKSIKKIDKKL